MQESAKAALSVIRARSKELGIEGEFYKEKDIHVHIPEGATPKDGPSAGITMCTSMASALTGIPVRKDLAMTGEITLRGNVLPIGGVKEKVIAAHRAGVKVVLLPEENMADLDDVPSNVRRDMTFKPMKTIDEVLGEALVR
jgi:ATP-dependent Lon protease